MYKDLNKSKTGTKKSHVNIKTKINIQTQIATKVDCYFVNQNTHMKKTDTNLEDSTVPHGVSTAAEEQE